MSGTPWNKGVFLPILPRLLARRRIDAATECWEWTGRILKNGYGMLRRTGVCTYVHRAAFDEFIGPIPDGMLVCHHCDNRKCFNPDHLFIGSHLDNMRDCSRKGRCAKPGLGLFGTRSSQSVLSDADVLDIRRLAKSGVSQRAIARRFGVTQANVWHIVKRKTWPHLEDVA